MALASKAKCREFCINGWCWSTACCNFFLLCIRKQYIPQRNIRRLDSSAAVVLMGCSSGRLSYRGDYEPAGVPLSYLIAALVL
ncbi:hypothetical protein SUGI_0280570 [Cryptomeria japonica]|nr:hypothetical protein SUGI_0280570 [Cryptomeria japonica]